VLWVISVTGITLYYFFNVTEDKLSMNLYLLAGIMLSQGVVVYFQFKIFRAVLVFLSSSFFIRRGTSGGSDGSDGESDLPISFERIDNSDDTRTNPMRNGKFCYSDFMYEEPEAEEDEENGGD